MRVRHDENARDKGWLGAAVAGGLVAGASAQLADLLIYRRPIGGLEALAATAAVAWLGLAIALLAAVPLFLSLPLLRRWCTPNPGPRLASGVFAGTGVALVAAGYAWMAGAGAPLDELPDVTRVALVVAPLVSAGAGLLAALLVPAARLARFGAARFSSLLSLILISLLLVAVAMAGRGFGLPGITAGATAALVAAAVAERWLGAFPRIVAVSAITVFVALTALAWQGPRAAGGSTPPRAAPGSVVLIVLDTQRADALSPYGAPAGSTPALARLAREGTLFEQMISPSPWTVPSHASIFTGLFPRSHRCWFGDRRWLEDDLDTVAERFAAAGHETAAFVSNGYLFITNLLQGFELQQPLSRKYDDLVLTKLMRYTGIGWERWIDKGASEAVSGIDEWLRTRDPARPFFLFVNLFEVHEPYHAPHADRILPDGRGPLDAMRALRGFETTRWLSLAKSDGADVELMQSLYAAEVRYQDRLLRELLARLERHVGLDTVALVVTSDHGENLGEGGRWGHVFALNDALIQVPLIVRAPGFAAGARETRAFQTLDIAPTLLELGGLDASLGEGVSLAIGSRTPRSETYAEVYPDYFRIARMRIGIRPGLGRLRSPLSAVRRDGEKLVVWGSGESALYDLRTDPAETRDLSAERADQAADLAERLRAFGEARPRDALEAGQHAPLDPETRKQLEALGYL